MKQYKNTAQTIQNTVNKSTHIYSASTLSRNVITKLLCRKWTPHKTSVLQ